MTPTMYLLAFAFLLITSLLFLLWHCRLSRLGRQERRQVETQDSASGDDAAMAALSGLTTYHAARRYMPRGTPVFLIRALPTHVFSAQQHGDDKPGVATGKVSGVRRR
jgi:hypothetical protein